MWASLKVILGDFPATYREFLAFGRTWVMFSTVPRQEAVVIEIPADSALPSVGIR